MFKVLTVHEYRDAECEYHAAKQRPFSFHLTEVDFSELLHCKKTRICSVLPDEAPVTLPQTSENTPVTVCGTVFSTVYPKPSDCPVKTFV